MRPATSVMRLLCPAKINLHLRVGPRRADGFHSLLSWMVTVGLFDTLTIQSEHAPVSPPGEAGAAGRDACGVSVGSSPGGLPAPERPIGAAGGTGTARGIGGSALFSGATAPGPVAIAPAAPIALVCDPPDLPCDARNLVVRVAAAWGLEVGWRGPSGSPGPSDATAVAAAGVSAERTAPPPPGAARVSGGQAGMTPARDAAEPDQLARVGPARRTPTGRQPPAGRLVPLRAVLRKRIPVGAGLGGGSSDAARTLLALDRLSDTNRAAADLSAFAARFGSDLPFFLFGPSSVCQGRGEVVRPVERPRPRWVVLVLPPIHMPTADVYRRFDELGLGRDEDLTNAPDWRAWAGLGATDLLARLVNDLEPAAFSLRPDLGELRQAIERSAGRTVRMSGSGSSLFTLFDDRSEAEAAARVVARDHGLRVEAVELAPRVEDDLARP